MARANRHHLPGYVWHITHRCHKREFLLKFEGLCFTDKEIDKIEMLKRVIKQYDSDIETIEFDSE